MGILFKLKAETKPLKKVFKTEYIIVIIVAVLALILLFSSSSSLFDFNKTEANSINYSEAVEKQLEVVLSEVKGAGKIKAMVTVDGSEEQIYLKNIESTLENGIKTVKESIVLIGGKPFLVKTNNPKIVGVVVVCEGADDVSVKLSVVEIITTTLSISADKVRIIKMK